MPQPYYIADGFIKDAEDLLHEFTQLNNPNFQAFAEVWRKRNFSLIFMGRQCEKELYDFTQEIFSVTLTFVPSVKFLHEVGTFYLLYGLYRNQVTHPPVRIRMPVLHVQRMLALQSVEPCPSLHYVFNYLLKNSIDFVASPRLFGPTTPSASDECKMAENLNTLRLLSDSKKNLKEFTDGVGLDDLATLFDQYADLTQKLNFHSASSDSSTTLRGITSRLKDLYGNDKKPGRRAHLSQPSHTLDSGSTSIGLKRVQLKAKAFKEHAVSEHVSRHVESDDSGQEMHVKPSLPRLIKRQKRVPKSERTVGRKKKVVVDEDADDPEICVSKLEQLLPEIKKSKRRHNRVRNYCTLDESGDSEREMWRDLPGLRGEMFASHDEYISESDSSARSSLDASLAEPDVPIKLEDWSLV